MGSFDHLLAPGRIGPVELRNRILLCPMGDLLAEADGTVGDRQAAYFEARARGGAALLLVGSMAVAYPVATYHDHQSAISDDAQLPGLRRLTDSVHRHGGRIAAQLVHNGPAALADIAHGRPVLVPSRPSGMRADALSMMVTPAEQEALFRPFVQPTSTFGHRVATEEDLAEVIEQYADAAERAREAGFDGVEVHAGHGYLIDTFLSPASNHRDDAWGGSLEGRARLLTEVLAAVRDRVGDDLAVWCRFNAFEKYKAGGETFDDALGLARLAEAAGVDALHVSAYADAGTAVGITEAHTPHEPGLLVPYAAQVKAIVDVPVITFGRLEPAAAEQVLADGHADFVAMGRALLADPDLPRKLVEDRVGDVRPCIYQYRCIGNIFLGESVACVANPATGRGDADAESPVPSAAPRHVVVVGGGPAGLEVARLLDGRGHRVTLLERADALGGTLALGARIDEALEPLRAWLVRQVERSGVEVHLATEATPELLVSLAPDEVVVASGARWLLPDVPGLEELGDGASEPGAGRPSVVTADHLAPWATGAPEGLGREVRTVALLGGGKAAVSVACRLAAEGHEVLVLERGDVFVPELGLPGRFRWVHDAEQAGVRLVPGVEVTGLDGGELTWGPTGGAPVGGPGEEGAGDGDRDGGGAADGASAGRAGVDLVVSFLSTPDVALADAVEEALGAGVPVHRLGDAAALGRIEGAMAGAAALAAALG